MSLIPSNITSGLAPTEPLSTVKAGTDGRCKYIPMTLVSASATLAPGMLCYQSTVATDVWTVAPQKIGQLALHHTLAIVEWNPEHRVQRIVHPRSWATAYGSGEVVTGYWVQRDQDYWVRVDELSGESALRGTQLIVGATAGVLTMVGVEGAVFANLDDICHTFIALDQATKLKDTVWFIKCRYAGRMSIDTA